MWDMNKIIAVGLVAICVIYAIGSIMLNTPISEAILGTVLGGLIGVLKGGDPRKDAGGDTPQSKTAETLDKVAQTAGEAQKIVEAFDGIKETIKK